MRVVVYGLWHLGCVTAACTAAGGHRVIGLDADQNVIADLRHGKAPIQEPGLDDLLARQIALGNLSFTSDAIVALSDAEVLWVCFDTPVTDQDEADVDFLRQRLDAVADALRPGALVLISSQVPVGFTASLARRWQGRDLQFAYSPENLRLGTAIDAFTKPDRVIIGTQDRDDRQTHTRVAQLFLPYARSTEAMSIESAEMSKHALNAFFAMSIAFANELARLCEAVGADARDVARALKSEARIGPRAYLSPGGAFAGGTLARDVRFLMGFGREHHVDTSLMSAVVASNDVHKKWSADRVKRLLAGAADPVVALLGLVYKVGTSTLRRSASVELARQLHDAGMKVRAFDPAVTALPAELQKSIELCSSLEQALVGADVAVVGTPWPQFLKVPADELIRLMRRPNVVDPAWSMPGNVAGDSRIAYFATGRNADGK
jgi:UDPglucose 6-dehydrogenase